MAARERILILGAGPAGIGAGLALGDAAIVLEGSPDLGGLCRTIELDGAVFDWGGHSFHTHHAAIRDLVFGALEMYEQTRDARCYFQGELIPYPFQKHFQQLRDPILRAECAAGLQTAPGGKDATHLEEYFEQRFGPGIARHFLLPYNRKLWGPELSQLAVDWVQERVAQPADSEPPAPARQRTPLQGDSRVAYPARGGFGEVFRALAGRLSHLQLAQTVMAIHPLRRQLVTARGDVFVWSRIVSTLPIPKLLRLLTDVPAAIHEAASRLRALPLALVLIVVGHPVDTPIQRVYNAGSESPAHKIALNHNSSPFLRSLPQHGILAEVSLTSGKLDQARLVQQVVQSLQRMGLIRGPEVVRTAQVRLVPLGYPLPTPERGAVVQRIKAWLAHRGIDSIGRFGEWAYINSDEALHRGLCAGEALSRAA